MPVCERTAISMRSSNSSSLLEACVYGQVRRKMVVHDQVHHTLLHRQTWGHSR
jgi:hypothetical protein